MDFLTRTIKNNGTQMGCRKSMKILKLDTKYVIYVYIWFTGNYFYRLMWNISKAYAIKVNL